MAKNDFRSHVWTFIVYPDSAVENWLFLLDSLHIPVCVSPLHDKDVNPTGEIKKPHYHVVLDFGQNKKSWDQVKSITDMVGGVLCPMDKDGNCESKVANKRTMTRYLIHLDNPEKAQYNIDDVRSFGGYDFVSICMSASSRYQTLRNILQFCDQEHIYNFSELVDYCAEYNYTWFMILCDGSTVFIKEYMKSKTWKKKIENIKTHN